MKLLSIIVLSVFCNILSAQQNFTRQLEWSSDSSFVGSQLEYRSNRVMYYEVIAITSNQYAEIQSAKYQTVNDSLFAQNWHIDTTAQITSSVTTARDEQLLNISIFPYRRNAITRKIEKLLSFSYILKPKNTLKTAVIVDNEPLQSVLRKGGWVKIACSQSGIYKISYQDLQNYGFSDPQSVRIYGNGDDQLPSMNNEAHKTDLLEVPLAVYDGGDNVLQKDDYVLFYANSPHSWDYDTTSKSYNPNLHNYTDSNYYFLTTSEGWGKRISQAAAPAKLATESVNQYIDCAVYDLNDTNLVRSGQMWLRSLGTIYKTTFNCPNFIAGSSAVFTMSAAVRSSSELSITLNANGQTAVFKSSSWSASDYGDIASDFVQKKSIPISAAPITVSVSYPYSSNNRAWLDYLAINAPSTLRMTGNQIIFRSPSNKGSIAEYQISSSQNFPVWDVTDPNNAKTLQTSFDGNTIRFISVRDTNREFIVFKNEQYLTPKFSQRVANQNLHQAQGIDMLIVVNTDLRQYAQQIADYHTTKDGLRCLVVSQQQIFNEYSSGKPDPAAFRNFFRHLYKMESDKSKTLKYVLLFGDGSYNNRDLQKHPTNIITYQSVESMYVGGTYVSDDYFGMLDDNEGVLGGTIVGGLDIGIGRITVSDAADAKAVVSKIINYHTNPNSKGNWQNVMTFLSDDADKDWETSFTSEAEKIADSVHAYNQDIIFDKIYLDAYKQEASAGGNSYPEAAKALKERIAKGSLAINYFGHANQVRLSSENILSSTDVLGWSNIDHLPLFITAGCQVGRYDDFSRKSLGEIILSHDKGGGIGLLTTTRYVENYSNILLVSNVCKFLFARENGHALTLGQIAQRAKNRTGGTNQNNFSLLGDPALRIALPENKIVTDSVNHKPISANDTISALENISVQGHLETPNGSNLTSFNGFIYPILYDKKQNIKTLNNEGHGEIPFTSQKSILFKGKASVKKGQFSFSFMVPKDIAYNYDWGLLSYYATNDTLDASGNSQVMVGGISTKNTSDTAGPHIQVFMNDTLFKSGGITDQNPVLLVYVNDQTGFNWSSAGIGHTATAVLDSNVTNGYVLNDFFESKADNATTGIIRYPLFNLSDGEHSINVKLWDVYNNSAQAQTSFIVSSSAKLALTKVLACPNPFNTTTTFSFEHNQQAQNLDVAICIYSMSGELVKSIHTQYYANGFTDQNVAQWDGSNDNGAPLGRGLYLFRVNITNAAGETAQKIERVAYLKN